jgi:hypothetical protein
LLLKKFLRILIISMLLFSLFPNFNKVKAQGGTVVSGPILTDTVWTKDHSPYNISEKIQVAENATLTIEPGVEVEGGTIELWGNLKAAGTKENPVIFKRININDVNYNNGEAINIELDFVFSKGMYLTSYSTNGLLKISNSKFQEAYLVSGNTSLIEHNLFVKSFVYLANDYYSKLMSIQDNSFYQSEIAYNNALWVFKNNNLYSSKMRIDSVSSTNTAHAESNYWGTTDSKEIDKMIIDRHDDLNIGGYVDYSNFLSQPNVNAPDTTVLTKEPSVSIGELTDKSVELVGKINDDIDTLFTSIDIYPPGVPYEILPIEKDGTFKIKINAPLVGVSDITLRVSYYGLPYRDIVIPVQDTTPPKNWEVYDITDQETKVVGVTEANATVSVRNDVGEIGSSAANNEGSFVVEIPKQKAGTILSVVAIDRYGNQSTATKINVIDVTPPEVPTVNEVNDHSTNVTGTAEAGSAITIEEEYDVIGSGVTDIEGKFSVNIPKQQAGGILTVKAEDRAGNISEGKVVTVMDKTAPAVPDVYPVLENDPGVSGRAEAGSKVQVKVNQSLLGTGITDSYGYFNVNIPAQKAGTELVVTAADKDGNISEPAFMVVYDMTPPVKPTVNEVTDKATAVTGQAESGSQVEVIVNDSVIGSGTVGTDGKFTIKIPVQKAGTEIFVTATDKTGNASDAAKVVVKDVTAPGQPSVNVVSDKNTSVTGKAEVGSKVEVKVSGTVIGSATAGTDGVFTIKIPVQKAGTEIVVTATDKAGNVSSAAKVVVKDATAPGQPAVNVVSDKDTSVKGNAEAGSKVEVKVSGTVIGSATAGTDGKFTVTIPVQKAGTEVVVTAIDKAGNASAAAKVVVKDATAPGQPTVNAVTDKDTSVTGKAEAGSKLEAKVSGTVIGSATAGTDGKFTVTIPVQKAGTEIVVTATDKAGNISSAEKVVVKDVTAPGKPTVNVVSEKNTSVTGQAEAGSKVEAKVSGTVIGSATAGTDGKFTVTIPVQKAGTEIVVTATDKAGNVSTAAKVVVKDVTAPGKPTVSVVSDKDTSVSGQAEAGSKVEVKVSGAIIGSGTTGTDGKFTVTIPVQKSGTKLVVTAADLSGNVSEGMTITVKDATSPEAPKVDELTDRETVLTGSVEPSSAIIAKVSGVEIGRGTADSNGKFKVAISKQASGQVVEVFAMDNAGNVSPATKVTVNKKLVSLVGETRYATAVKVSQTGWKTADTVLLVNGFAIVDGLTATPLASAKDAPILLTAADSISKTTMDEITRLKAKEIILIG